MWPPSASCLHAISLQCSSFNLDCNRILALIVIDLLVIKPRQKPVWEISGSCLIAEISQTGLTCLTNYPITSNVQILNLFKHWSEILNRIYQRLFLFASSPFNTRASGTRVACWNMQHCTYYFFIQVMSSLKVQVMSSPPPKKKKYNKFFPQDSGFTCFLMVWFSPIGY